MSNVKMYEDDLQEQLGTDDEVQYTERFAMQGYDFIITAGHGFLVVPNDSPDYFLAKKIVKYGHKGLFAIYLEEDDEMPEFLKAVGVGTAHPTQESIKKIKLTNEDISKYATEEELYLLEAKDTKPIVETTDWTDLPDEENIKRAEAMKKRMRFRKGKCCGTCRHLTPWGDDDLCQLIRRKHGNAACEVERENLCDKYEKE